MHALFILWSLLIPAPNQHQPNDALWCKISRYIWCDFLSFYLPTMTNILSNKHHFHHMAFIYNFWTIWVVAFVNHTGQAGKQCLILALVQQTRPLGVIAPLVGGMVSLSRPSSAAGGWSGSEQLSTSWSAMWLRWVILCFLHQKGGKITVQSLQSCFRFYLHSYRNLTSVLGRIGLWFFSNPACLFKITFIT